MRHRGLLTEKDREFLRNLDPDELDELDEDTIKKLRNIRYNFRQRTENTEEDIEILREAGQDDLVEEFYAAVGRFERLESKLFELQDQLEE
ncbi:hypothetical protein [Halocatena halophila]|uniref:hypothetical protein n=1 Tax=Halocatena halophila TaxID=2814576 RepID=UPI002ED55CEF